MKLNHDVSVISIKDINLWAHVGVLEKEIRLGQDFLLDVEVSVSPFKSPVVDDLSFFVDYGEAIRGLQSLALNTNCQTIEVFSELILDFLDNLYGSLPTKIVLKKCFPPVDGFDGSVSIIRMRNFISEPIK